MTYALVRQTITAWEESNDRTVGRLLYELEKSYSWISLTNEDRLVIDNEYINELGSVEHFKAVEEKLKELNQ